MAIRLLSSENVQGNIDIALSQNAISYLAVTNDNTGVAANARVQVVGESAQLDMIATSAGYTGVTGWADSGIISTDSGASGGLKLNSQAGGIQLQAGTTSYVTMDASGYVGINMAPDTAVRLSVSGAIGPTNGTEGAPTHTFYGDPDTGMFRSGANTLGFSTGGTTRLSVRAAGIDVVGETETDSLKVTGTTEFTGGATFGGNIIIYNSSNAPYIDFVENGDLSDSKARIQMDQIDTDNATLRFSTEGGGTLSERMRIDENGNVGIQPGGATLTNTRLYVVSADNYDPSLYDGMGGIRISSGGSSSVGDGNYTGGIGFAIASGTSGIAGVQNGPDGDRQGLAFFTHPSTTGGDAAEEKMRIDADGNVTIGNSTYGSSLGQLRVINDAASSPASLSLFGYNNVADNTDFAIIEFAMQTSGTGGNVLASIKGQSDGTSENAADLRFGTANSTTGLTEKMRITSAGNVGIGTASPDYKLEIYGVDGTSYLGFTSDVATTGARIGFNSDDLIIENKQASGDTIFDTAATERMRITSAGAIEIKGTSTTTSAQAFITNDNSVLTIGSSVSGSVVKDIQFNSPSAMMYIDGSTGNVGIGVTSPSGKLEVAGGSTLGLRLSNVGDQSAYDQVRFTYSGYNSGAPTCTIMPLTTPGSGNVYTTFKFSNTNGINATSNNNANVEIDGTLQVGAAKGSGETTLILRNYDGDLTDAQEIQNSIRMTGRYWSGANSQLIETRINSVHQIANGNGGSAMTFMTQTGGDGPREVARFTREGNMGLNVTSPSAQMEMARSNPGVQLSLLDSDTTTGAGPYLRIMKAYSIDTADRKAGIVLGSNAGNFGQTMRIETRAPGAYWGDMEMRFIYNGGGNNATITKNIMTLKQSGNVGINQSSPTRTLHVEGEGSGTTDVLYVVHGNGSHTGDGITVLSANTGKPFYIDGSVGSGFAEITTAYNANPNFRISGDVVAYATSDKRFKDNLKVIENPIDKVQQLNGYTFDWNDKQDLYKGKDYGVVAQEVEKVMPEIVDTRFNGHKAVKYEKVVPLLIEAIKELKAEIEELKKSN